jgi:hypothetical protein
MCTEVLLAFLYFITLCIVNIFLWKLLFSYIKNISLINKIKKITLSTVPETEISIYFLLLKEKKIKKEVSINKLKTLFSKQNKIQKKDEDILVLANYYQYLTRKKLSNFFERLFSLQFIDTTVLQNTEAL